jgi:oligosaccharide reducing-end xylanase
MPRLFPNKKEIKNAVSTAAKPQRMAEWTSFGASVILILSLAVSCRSVGSKTDLEPAGAFATGRYRNLFAEAGHSPQEVSAKVEAAFQQLFHGDSSTQAVYFVSGANSNGPLAYISDVGNGDVRSEGMSYGMMIAVQLNKKAEFDSLWNWAKTYMYHSSTGHPACGFFSWSVRTNGVPNDEMPAPDGEEYFATSLYFASGRWGNSTGIYNYRAEADRLLTDMLHHEPITGHTVRGKRTGGAMFNTGQKMIRFTTNLRFPEFTNPSYQLPGFYEFWAKVGPVADRPFWAQAASASRDFLYRVANPTTGLTPDQANFDGTPRASQWGDRQSANFQFDAWRTAMNWSTDWAWWARDVRERQLSDRLQAFFESKGMTNYGNRFTLDGQQVDADHSTGLVAMNAVASLAATQPRAKQFVEVLWDAPIPSGRWRYYDGMLYLMGLLYCSGEFRIWPPQ